MENSVQKVVLSVAVTTDNCLKSNVCLSRKKPLNKYLGSIIYTN